MSKFIPGQWLDLHFDGLISKAGGYGYPILSTPSAAAAVATTTATTATTLTSTVGNVSPAYYQPYVELAVEKTPQAQQQLWADVPSVIGMELMVSVRGGSFIWPPSSSLGISAIRSVVFLAGGEGVW